MKPFRLPQATLLITALLTAGPVLHAQSAVPDIMSYQAYVTDAANAPLAPDNPTNFEVVFRIYGSPGGDDILWAERQTVTIFQGNFSVLLGQGQVEGGEPKPPLAEVFEGGMRYLGITVGANPEFTPRQRLLSNAYAFRARVAESLGTAVSTNGANTTFAGGFTAGSASTINGNLSVGGNGTFADLSVDGSTLNVNPATNTVLLGGALNVDGFSNLDGFQSVGNSSVNGNFSVSGNLGIGQGDLTVDSGVNEVSIAGSLDVGESISAVGTLSAGALNVSGTGNFGNLTVGQGDLVVDSGPNRVSIAGDLNVGQSVNVVGGLTVDHIVEITGRIEGPLAINRQRDGLNRSGLAVQAPPGDNSNVVQFYSRQGNYVSFIAPGGALQQVSDRSLKEDIAPLDGCLAKALALKPSSYRWKSSPDRERDFGFIAQEVDEVLPHLVDQSNGIMSVNYSGMGVIAIGALQELHDRVETLQTEKDELAARNRKLEERLARIEQLLAADLLPQ